MKILTFCRTMSKYLCFRKRLTKQKIIMKKKNLKLGLNKRRVSNLNAVKGGNDTRVGSCTCPSIDTTGASNDCPNTQETTCWSGLPKCEPDPTGNCLTHENTCVCFYTEGVPCI